MEFLQMEIAANSSSPLTPTVSSDDDDDDGRLERKNAGFLAILARVLEAHNIKNSRIEILSIDVFPIVIIIILLTLQIQIWVDDLHPQPVPRVTNS
mmetsp:Transcript_17663/g.43494  ORF Transcript_17663/g.43494 Transcript_17663/m.43494 type:complete len:96 (+) Transcript_17663:3075-3362(+)